MVDSVRIKEIHACLGAGEFAYFAPDTPIFMNVARKLDYVAKVWGVNFDQDGNEIQPEFMQHIPQGEDIPPGYGIEYFDRQVDGEKLGIVYPVRSNLIINDASGEPEEITQGGYILCESWIQYFTAMLADLDKALDWQNLGGGMQSFNGKTLVTEGLFDLIQEISIVTADTNQTTEQTRISSLVTQQLAKEILKAIGLPAIVKKINFKLQNQDTSGQTEPIVAEIPYSGVADQSPTIVSLIMMLLENIALGNIGKLQINDEEALKQVTEVDKNILPIQDDFANALKILQDWFKVPSQSNKP